MFLLNLYLLSITYCFLVLFVLFTQQLQVTDRLMSLGGKTLKLSKDITVDFTDNKNDNNIVSAFIIFIPLINVIVFSLVLYILIICSDEKLNKMIEEDYRC